MEMLVKTRKHGDFLVHFDSEDYNKINELNWNIRIIKGQCNLRGRKRGGDRKGFSMPCIVLDKFSGRIIHKDGNKLNNIKDNLIHIPDNEYFQKEDYYEIKCSSLKLGVHIIFIDMNDYKIVSEYEWHVSKQGQRFYAYANINSSIGHKMISMHRLIMGFPENMEVDHIDNNGINNRKLNLRIGTHAQNNMNKGLQVSNTTGFKGVHFFKRDQNYQVYIDVHKKRIHGGYFDNIIEAAKKYNELAIKYHGSFAKLNIIPNE